MSAQGRAWTAMAALAAIVVITAAWWALALWPVSADGADWILRTREVCFGAAPGGLPTAGGWLLLVGQPLGMVALLVAVWGAELRAGFALAMARTAGQLLVGATVALVVGGIVLTTITARAARVERFPTGAPPAAALTRLNDAAPSFSLVDQSGRQVTLESFRGRPVIVTFAFAHCETICQVVVSDVLAARRRLGDMAPVVLILTLDPWRDTPARLPAIASAWGLDADAHVLSGPAEDVERALNAWRVPRVRNGRTGDISHPSIVYIVAPDGRITYVVNGGAETISAAVLAL